MHCALQAVADWEQKEAERAAAAGAKPAKADEAADAGGTQFVAFVPLPDQKAIEARVLAKKKQDLIAKYASDSLLGQQEEAKALLNKR